MKKRFYSLLILLGLLTALLPVGAYASEYINLSQAPVGAPIIYTSADVDCYAGDYALLTAAATSTDGGVLQYQWFSSPVYGNTNGVLIMGANAPEFSPDTSAPGVNYYYCQVRSVSGAQYNEAYSQPIRVSVNMLSVESIAVSGMPFKTVYNEGDYLDAAGLNIVARMSNGTERFVDAGYQLSPTQFFQLGPQNVTVSYGGKSCTFPVTVQSFEESIMGIGMVTMPMKTEYKVGDFLDTTGIVFRAYSQNGYKDMNSGFVCEPMLLDRAGSQTITLIYANKTCTFNVTVKESAKLLEISSTPRKLTYAPGEALDTAGLVLKLSDGYSTQIINSGFSCEPSVFTSEGTQVVKVRYNDLLATFTVKVSAAAAATANPVVSAAPTARPSEAPIESPQVSPSPSASPRPNRIEHDSYETRSNKSTLIVVMVLCIIALVVLGVMMVLINSGGMEALQYKLRRFMRRFRSNRRR